jgi:RNA polymerase sigma factor (sigma-70 family)
MASFPPTRNSVVLATRSGDPDERHRAFDVLIAAYWKPVYKYLRMKWHASPEDAQDLTQEFFARAIEKSFFARYDPAIARFRTFLRTCLDGFAANERKAAARLKRGGGARHLPLDFETAEGEYRRHEPAADVDLDDYFHREWVRALFARAVDALRGEYREAGKTAAWGAFERYDLADSDVRPTYKALADDLGLSVVDVTNRLAGARRDLRRHVLALLQEACGSDEEYHLEARDLFGSGPGRQ